MVGVRQVQRHPASLEADQQHLDLRVVLEGLQHLVPRAHAHVPGQLVALDPLGCQSEHDEVEHVDKLLVG